MNLATNQRAQRRDRTNDYVCHLDHLLQLPWADHRRAPPTEAARPKSIFLRMTSIAAPVKISRCEYDSLAQSIEAFEKQRHGLVRPKFEFNRCHRRTESGRATLRYRNHHVDELLSGKL